jgi:hypothetical protein
MNRDEAKEKFHEAERLFAERQFARALDVLTELDRTYPNQRHILYPMARCLAGLKRRSEAMDLADRIARDFDYGPAKELKDRLKDKHARISSLPPVSSISSFDPPADTPKPKHAKTPPPADDPPPAPKLADATAKADANEVAHTPAPVAFGACLALIALSFAVYAGVGATVAQPAIAFAMDADGAPAQTPWQELMFLWAGLAVHLCMLACLPLYAALRLTGALRGARFRDDLIDAATFVLYGFLLTPIVVVGWFIYFVLLRREFGMTTGQTARTIAVSLVLFVAVSAVDWAILTYGVNPVLAGL